MATTTTKQQQQQNTTANTATKQQQPKHDGKGRKAKPGQKINEPQYDDNDSNEGD